MKNGEFHFIELTLYYVAILIMLREWLVPISELTQIGYLDLILLFAALSMLLSILKAPMLSSIIIKIFYISWFTVYVYTRQLFFTPSGFSFLINEIKTNMAIVLSGRVFDITDPIRSIMFLILIWMLLYLIEHWITVRMSIFYFLLFTIFFIATLDTFTPYDGTVAIVKIVVLGLLMIAFLMVKRQMVQSNVPFQWSKFIKLVVPIVLFVGVTSSAAIVLPKAEPQWPDPVPFIKSVTGQNGVSKVGYDDDDTELGGSFVGDDTLVFTVQAKSKQYWRVETKDVYTSKGWEKSDYFNEWLSYEPSETIIHSLPVGPKEEIEEAYIQVFYPYDFILQSYGLMNVSFNHEEDERNIQLLMDVNSEKLMPYANRTIVQVSHYSVQYSQPTYKYSDLMKTDGEIDPIIIERYLQLPTTLPTRVGELANQIVEGKSTAYEKARAIEQYFSNNGYQYDTENVLVPLEDEDYVDQFLFESKIGYCDNFSTAMVVLLRSVGIPARWVKGFAGGEQVHSDGEMKTFEITNNEAHSWVEAYIPNVGWMNFEPTIGFSNVRSIDYDIDEQIQETELIVEEETKPKEQIEELQDEAQPKMNVTPLKQSWMFIGFVISFMIVLVIGYKLRRRWFPKLYLLFVNQNNLNEDTFEQHYLKLLKMLELQGLERRKGQTLQDFAKEVDAHFSSNHMFELTKVYEQYIYGKDKTTIDFTQVKESWEYLINRCSS